MKVAAANHDIVRDLMPNIDRTLLRENLKPSFEQHAQKHLRVLHMIEELRRTGKKLIDHGHENDYAATKKKRAQNLLPGRLLPTAPKMLASRH